MNRITRRYRLCTTRSQTGFTLLELLITLYIAGITATLIFTSYRGLTIGFARHSMQAARVQEALRLKTRLDGLFAGIDSVSASYGSTLEWTSADSRTHRLSRRGASLRYGSAVLADEVTDVAWEIETAESGTRRVSVLFWSVELAGRRWIGGGSVIGE